MSHIDQAKSWLQARFIEQARQHKSVKVYTSAGARDPTEEEQYSASVPVETFHNFLISIGAQVNETLHECMDAGWICYMEGGFQLDKMHRFYKIQNKVMDLEPTKSNSVEQESIIQKWIGGECPKNLVELLAFLSQRSTWYRQFINAQEEPLCIEFSKDIQAWVWPPKPAPPEGGMWVAPDERGIFRGVSPPEPPLKPPAKKPISWPKWQTGEIVLHWANIVFMKVNLWLDSFNLSGPRWKREPLNGLRVDEHFSDLIAWCEEKTRSTERKINKWNIIVAIILAAVFIFLFEVDIYWTSARGTKWIWIEWIRKHPHSIGLQLSFDSIVLLLSLIYFVEPWRKNCWKSMLIPILAGIYQIIWV